MQKKIAKTIASFLMMAIMLITAFGQFTLTAEAVTPSTVNYNVYLNGNAAFVCNKKANGAEVGTEYFMTYTVKKVEQNPLQQGLVGTDDCTQNYPYEKGGLLRGSNDDQHMLDEGATYFIRFRVAEGGFRYNVTKAKGDALEEVYMEMVYGEGTDKMQHFGLWLGATTAKIELTNVRCYDAKGNDLGVYVADEQGMVLNASTRLKKDTTIDHRYDITINKQSNIAISHVKIPTTSKVYMEYKVESADYTFNQDGIALSNKPEAGYPHSTGILRYTNYTAEEKQVLLLDVGAEYIICMEKTEPHFNVWIQKTKNGVTTIHVLKTIQNMNTEKEDLNIFSLWFGESKTGSFKLTNFKCYDGNKNHLGVQCNKDAAIQHYGLMEDYAGCEATYYCKETENSFALYADQKLKFTKDNATQDGTYQISENVMTTSIGKSKENFDYLYKRITDSEGMKYERLYNYQVRFVTGTEQKIETQKLSNKYGYYAMRPTEPKMEGYEFEGWCLKDGTEFDFEKMVTESTVLYAKYSGDGGKVFIANGEIDEPAGASLLAPILISVSILAVGVVAFVLIMKRGQANGKEKKEN